MDTNLKCQRFSPFYGECDLPKNHEGKHSSEAARKPFSYTSSKEVELGKRLWKERNKRR